MRPSARKPDVLREISMQTNVNAHAEGSCLIKFGRTHVLCTATLETSKDARRSSTSSPPNA